MRMLVTPPLRVTLGMSLLYDDIDLHTPKVDVKLLKGLEVRFGGR